MAAIVTFHTRHDTTRHDAGSGRLRASATTSRPSTGGREKSHPRWLPPSPAVPVHYPTTRLRQTILICGITARLEESRNQ